MTTLRALIISRWSVTFIGTALLALLVWFFGPFFSIFESGAARLGAIVAMAIVWAGANLFVDHRRTRRDAALTKGVTEQPVDPAVVASAEEAGALQQKLTTALALLKRARGTKAYLYEQPWYVIIGPPGAGKTTALLNSGLRFPLAAEIGQDPIAGVGGTRLCDWLFTEDAVLIDTAGRYTTQDSDAVVDRAGWEAFLALLKRTRPRQPLNGLVVGIAIDDIGGASRDVRVAHARAVRLRIKEIEEKLAIRLPVYAIFTKADLIAGFSEFFDDLDREKRAQVWGTTFPLAQGETSAVGGFASEFHALVERLNTRLLDRLQAERSPDRRALIAGFPAQVASLEIPLAEFLQEAFGGSRLDPAPLLRGFYFTSGTQEGAPLDRLTGFLARSFGIDQRGAPALRPLEGRSYFLARLVKEVIFGEAMLVSEKPGAASRRLLLRGGGFAGAALAVLVATALLWHSDRTSRQDLGEMNSALAAYKKTTSGLSLDPVADADLPRILPLLDQARALPHGYDRGKEDRLSWLQFGLSQRGKLTAGADTVYRHALERILLPRLIWRLEEQMHGAIDRPDYLYEATRVYLMLGGQAGIPLDRDLVRTWMSLDWEATYPGAVMAPVREDLRRHLDALLADPLPQIPLDGALLDAARRTFSRVPPAERVYSRIAASGAAQNIPQWRPAEALGAAGVRVFVRASGKPLTDGVRGFYTIDGFYKVLLPALGDVTKQVASESWVLGRSQEIVPDSAEARQLEHDVIALYEDDYVKHWDAMLKDLSLVPLRNEGQATQDLYVLGAPDSPIRTLFVSIARQLKLTQPPPPSPEDKAKSAAAGAAKQSAPALLNRLLPLIGTRPNGPPPAPPGKKVEDHFRGLLEFVGTGPGAPLDQSLKAIDSLRQQLAAHANPAPGAGAASALPPSGQDSVQLMRDEALRAPPPMARWLDTTAASGNALISGRTRDQAKDAWDNGPAALCRKATDGRYPFVPGASIEIPMDDFTRLFSPGGLIDAFFNTQLRPYVDTSGEGNWKTHPVDGVPAPVSPADLMQFQKAALIRELFFAAGGASPAVRFDITPDRLDNESTQVTLDIGGVTVAYAHGPQRATQITWPGQSAASSVRLVFDPPSSGGTGVFEASGAWALFRLFDGRVKRTQYADRYELGFAAGDREASFEIRAGSVINPFTPGLLTGFQCPKF